MPSLLASGRLRAIRWLRGKGVFGAIQWVSRKFLCRSIWSLNISGRKIIWFEASTWRTSKRRRHEQSLSSIFSPGKNSVIHRRWKLSSISVGRFDISEAMKRQRTEEKGKTCQDNHHQSLLFGGFQLMVETNEVTFIWEKMLSNEHARD